MGMRKKLMDQAKDFKCDPHGQYFKHLDKLLRVSQSVGVPKKRVLHHVTAWAKK